MQTATTDLSERAEGVVSREPGNSSWESMMRNRLHSFFVLVFVGILASCARAPAQLPKTVPVTVPEIEGLSGRVPGTETVYDGLEYQGNMAGAPGGSIRFTDYPLVVNALLGSPAAIAGLKKGDVILSIDGIDARDPNVFSLPKLGASRLIKVLRVTEVLEFKVTTTIPPRTLE